LLPPEFFGAPGMRRLSDSVIFGPDSQNSGTDISVYLCPFHYFSNLGVGWDSGDAIKLFDSRSGFSGVSLLKNWIFFGYFGGGMGLFEITY